MSAPQRLPLWVLPSTRLTPTIPCGSSIAFGRAGMGHCRRYWVAFAVIGIGCAFAVRPRHQQLLYPAASASGPLSFPVHRRTLLGDDLGLRETTAIVRGVH